MGNGMNGTHIVVTGAGLAVPGLAGIADLVGPAPDEGGFDPVTGLAGRDMRHKDRATRLSLRAVEPALRDAGLLGPDGYLGDRDTTAVIVASNLGNLESVCRFTDVINDKSVTGLSPLGLPQTSINVITGALAIRHGLRGPNLTVSNGATSGHDALHWAVNFLRTGRAEAAVVVGVEPMDDAVVKLVGGGTVDGAAAVVLETAAHAAARGATARAAVAGYARTADGASAVAAVRGAATGPVGLWLAADAPAAPALDLEAKLGPCSGALGVLQCAAAVAHLDGGGTGPVLATAGGPQDDAVSALLVTPATT
jgi:3-oxoacyl-[acyl-carrier-protein] synthase II